MDLSQAFESVRGNTSCLVPSVREAVGSCQQCLPGHEGISVQLGIEAGESVTLPDIEQFLSGLKSADSHSQWQYRHATVAPGDIGFPDDDLRYGTRSGDRGALLALSQVLQANQCGQRYVVLVNCQGGARQFQRPVSPICLLDPFPNQFVVERVVQDFAGTATTPERNVCEAAVRASG